MVTLHFILTLHIHGLSFLRMIHKYIQRDGLHSSNRAAITFFALQCFEKFMCLVSCNSSTILSFLKNFLEHDGMHVMKNILKTCDFKLAGRYRYLDSVWYPYFLDNISILDFKATKKKRKI